MGNRSAVRLVGVVAGRGLRRAARVPRERRSALRRLGLRRQRAGDRRLPAALSRWFPPSGHRAPRESGAGRRRRVRLVACVEGAAGQRQLGSSSRGAGAGNHRFRARGDRLNLILSGRPHPTCWHSSYRPQELEQPPVPLRRLSCDVSGAGRGGDLRVQFVPADSAGGEVEERHQRTRLRPGGGAIMPVHEEGDGTFGLVRPLPPCLGRRRARWDLTAPALRRSGEQRRRAGHLHALPPDAPPHRPPPARAAGGGPEPALERGARATGAAGPGGGTPAGPTAGVSGQRLSARGVGRPA